MDKRLVTVMLAAVVFALVITAIFYQITSGQKPAEASVQTKMLVVATQDLSIGSMITEKDMQVIEFPLQGYPEGGFETTEEALDRSVIRPILENEPLTLGRVTEKGAGFGLAPLIPEGYRAIAISVNAVSGVSGFIMPGSRVDVLLTVQSGTQGADRVTTTVLENVTVLSTGHKQQPNENGQPENVPVVNMLLKPEEAELLTLASQEGKIQLVLRNPRDETMIAESTPLVRIQDLLTRGVPVPKPRAAAPRRAAPPPPPPPPPPTSFSIEVIRGNAKSVAEIERGSE